MIKSAYIHIPFCEHICHYCDFNKMFLKGQPVEEYLQVLKKEMELALKKAPTSHLDTIYVGGGTPTSLNEEQLIFLCETINEVLPFTHDQVEFTFEANPGDLSFEKMRILKEAGVNRISFGVQSFNEELLKAIGRTHKPEDVYTSIEKGRKAGFENITIDLMYGLPGQSMQMFKESIQEALKLQLPHYSSYSLIVEPKTVFYNMMQKNKLHLPTQDLEAEMYEVLMEEMERNGLHQYEISNFAKTGFESKHNTTYWNNEYYYGFGAGAHGYVNGERVGNYGPLKKYMEPIRNGQLPYMNVHPVPVHEQMEEEMFLGLRKIDGVSLSTFTEKFGKQAMEVFAEPIHDLLKRGLIEVTEERIFLTQKGKLLGNEVFQTFIGIS
ncbi:oxygen-independent coproporphyrinogen III oxidase [Bacillus sp. AGMB 02131]|uniref:Heme chaperone HemW n=1 Tax=Peribacillus faecalis TaxID=2772559 RepID=A0A927CZ37_9BACI|nr:radical SAM family heme chaperone HemW [Peribacillus faecalis]MBD3109744.1 oxygen-independent coproporphyrinogen III oxidase [Peribacillus faecalis]